MGKSARNLGIDLLRIISMLGVVFLHVLGHGGILASNLSPLNYSVAWFLETLAYPAVNCFVLISGYVGYKRERYFPKMKSIFSLFFTVLFYSVSIYLILSLLGYEPFGIKELVKNFMPIIAKRYWFFSTYFGLFLLSPVLNLLVHKSKPKPMFIFVITFFLICAISLIRDRFSLLNGFSLIWFILLYLIGAILKEYNISDLLRKRAWLILVVSSFSITLLPMIVAKFIYIPFVSNYAGILINYVSPTLVLMSIGLVCLFAKLKCSLVFAGPIRFFASSAFSVYLIHENPYIRSNFITKIHLLANNFHEIWLILFVVCCATAIFISCILIDKGRIALFRLIRTDRLAGALDCFLKKHINALYEKASIKIGKTAQ